MIILDLQNEYYKRRSELPDLSPFVFHLQSVDNLISNSIFKAIFDIRNAIAPVVYNFSQVSWKDIKPSNLSSVIGRTSRDLYSASTTGGYNLLNLNTMEVDFINSCITSSILPPMIQTSKDWLQAAYKLWKLDKNESFTLDDFTITCVSNLCKAIQLITSLVFLKRYVV